MRDTKQVRDVTQDIRDAASLIRQHSDDAVRFMARDDRNAVVDNLDAIRRKSLAILNLISDTRVLGVKDI